MDESLLPSQPELISFGGFLEVTFQALVEEGVRPCILRNYEGFPANNAAGDVDFLIRPSELPAAIRALLSLPGIRIIGYSRRQYVAHLFVEGIFRPPGFRALQIDFIWSLCWKGMQYFQFDAETVLKEAIERRGGVLNFLVPCPVHEAIISLSSGLHSNGRVKEKYFPLVQQTFIGERADAIAALSPEFGQKTATRLVDSVIDGDRRKIQTCVKSLHISMTLRNILHRPLRTVLGVTGYYARECAVCLSPRSLQAVYILGRDGRASAAVVEELMPLLGFSAMVVERRQFGPQLSRHQELPGERVSSEARIESRSGSLVSMARIVQWLLGEWRSRFEKKKGCTLRIGEGFRYEPLIDFQRYPSGIPKWFARLIARLLPSSDLWILLDPNPALRSVDQEPAENEVEQLNSYLSFVKTRKKHAIVATDNDSNCVTERAYAAIIGTLTERAFKALKHQF
jgi:hypothetical protein